MKIYNFQSDLPDISPKKEALKIAEINMHAFRGAVQGGCNEYRRVVEPLVTMEEEEAEQRVPVGQRARA